MDDLSKMIMQELEDYSNEIAEILEDEKEQVAQEAVQELKSSSPLGKTGKYAKGWKKTKQGTSWVVHNSTPGLPHLIEKGHAKRNGGRTKAQVHIKSVEEKVAKQFEENIEKRV